MQIVLKHCVKYTLDRNCQLKPLAYLNACVNGTSAGVINFDIDAKETIVDTDCSCTLTYNR